jgi:hypothetical protein
MKAFTKIFAASTLIFGTNAMADQVILDDLIVDGSACIGFDCVNGESFGFDTIRTKENNLRLHFFDTSSSASFPSVDWRITVNDSSNGGANRFSVDDASNGKTPFTIEANAPSHSLYVDDGGRVGFGTSTPVADLHVKSGNTPTLRLEQDGSSGFTAQTWDLAGNEANFFIRDATSGSTLPFRVFPGAPSNALTVEGSTGHIGIGTTSPDRDLDIEADGPGFRLTNTGPHGFGWEAVMNGNTGKFQIRHFDTAGAPLKLGPDAVDNLLKVGDSAANVVDIGGNLAVAGNITATGTITPDYVFSPDYELLSIEEHAEFMWQQSHLPKVEKAVANDEGKGVVDLVARSQGVLEELEIAHIYIAQLHEELSSLKAQNEQLGSEVGEIREMLANQQPE